MKTFHIPDEPIQHKIYIIKHVVTRVSDRDVPEAHIKLPLYGCRNCDWEGYAPVAYNTCDDPDISELTDILK